MAAQVNISIGDDGSLVHGARCVNIDWLEVHCLEPIGQPHDADFFRAQGYIVHEREYGTRVYKEMFILDDSTGQPFIEVRRNPKSVRPLGLHLPEECHLRLTNYACYDDRAAFLMLSFISAYGYEFNRISRIDICLDFEYFDFGDYPQAFLSRYLKHRYAKINQGNIHAHGADTWSEQKWNSLSWGAPTSDIGTKFYNKTMELFSPATNTYSKPYIRYAWLKCGLIDDFINNSRTNGDSTYVPQIWRVEFSIRSSVKNWFVIELNGERRHYQSIKNTLEQYDGRARLLTIFASLCNHYFHFKYYDPNKRKDRCPDKQLFKFDGQQFMYSVGREKPIAVGTKEVSPINTLIGRLKHYRETHFGADIHRACDILIRAMEGEVIRQDMTHPWSHEELLALQQVVAYNDAHRSADAAVLLNEIKEFLRINNNTAIF